MLAALLLSTTVNAQQSQKLVPGLKANNASTSNGPKVQAKSTAIESRVIAASSYNYANGFSYTLEDTAFLTYTGNRGHDSAFVNIKYDVLVNQTVVSTVLTNDEKSTQTFDSDDNIITNLEQNWNTGTNTWDNDYNTMNTYDSDNNLMTSVGQSWNMGTNSWDNDKKEVYTYDGDNNMLTHITQYWDNVFLTWVNSSQEIFNYNTNNDRTMYVNQYWNSGTNVWVNSSKHTYVYDANDDMVTDLYQTWDGGTMNWVNSNQHLYTYDANHHMLTDVYQIDVMTVWQNSSKTTNAYTGDDLTTSVMQFWNSIMTTWDNSSRNLRTYDADHNMTMDVSQSWDAVASDFENTTRIQIMYNSFNQFTTLWSDQWNAGIWQVQTSDMKQNYYYQTFGTSVANTTAKADFNLYPVPAQNFVRIEKTFSTPEAFTVSITDLQGRLIRTYSEKATTNYSRNIDVNQLAAGSYVIKVSGTNGKASYQQFSVMH